MRRVWPWIAALIFIMTLFVFTGGLHNRTSLIVMGIGLIAGVVIAVMLLRR
jgi:hypothetical protein